MTHLQSVFTQQANELVERIPMLDEAGKQVKSSVHGAILDGGESAREAADVLHGTWLGHPLHPLLTDITIGSWVLGGLFDIFALFSGAKGAQEAADRLTSIGIATAFGTALTGLTDFSGISQHAVRHGMLHGTINAIATLFYVISGRARRGGFRGLGVLFSMTGLGLATLGAWLGGDLVFRQGVGVNHAERITGPDDWIAVMADADLSEGQSAKVDVGGNPVLLYRHDGTVNAAHPVCSHAGGPLEDGSFNGYCVTCPWHDSVFDTRDGSVVHGPATFPVPTYRARIAEGQVEIRAEQAQ